jgi:proton-translocating NADH-quinone oxidoreductase chain N
MATNGPILLIALPLAAAPLVYLLGRLAFRLRLDRRIAGITALLALLALWWPFVETSLGVLANGPFIFAQGTITLRVDGLSLLLTAVILTLSTLVTLYSLASMAREPGEEKYYALILAMTGMMVGLGSATDLFNLWLWFEGMAVASYLLVAFYRERPATLEAGVKYLVQSAAGSVLVLLAIALVFGATGQLDLQGVQATASNAVPLVLAAALFTIGFGVKIALVPLHTWLPDAHSQAPSGISALLSGVVIEAGLVALLRALTALSGLTLSWGILLLVFGALNMLVGNLMALRQQQLKRMLAYSSLSHMGYILIGLGIGLYAGDAAGAQGGLFHLLNHGLMKGLAFLAAGAFLYVLGDSGHSLGIADLTGAARRYPLPALAFSLALLGLAGLPPLAGFMSKWQIFVAGITTHNFLIAGVVMFAALNSVLSLAYYAPLVNAVYRREASAAIRRGRPMPSSMVLPLLLLAAAIVLLGVWPGLVDGLTETAAEAVLIAFGG